MIINKDKMRTAVISNIERDKSYIDRLPPKYNYNHSITREDRRRMIFLFL